MRRPAKAIPVALGLAVALGAPLWQVLPADATARAPFVPLLLVVGSVVVASLTVYRDAIEEPVRVTGAGPPDGHSP